MYCDDCVVCKPVDEIQDDAKDKNKVEVSSLGKTRKTGVLLINLGTPDNTSISNIRKYLREFLSDPRVIDIPAVFRFILLYIFILPFRARRTQKAYNKIWLKDGSPLLVNSLNFKNDLQKELGDKFIVSLGMRYGNPSIKNAIDDLFKANCSKIKILPLFPQYSSAATGSALEFALKEISKKYEIPNIEVISDFHDDNEYINSLSDVILANLKNVTSNNIEVNKEHLIFSYHGLPLRQILKSSNIDSCYKGQCYATSKLVAKNLGLNQSQFSVAFQSRLGKTEWIKPYTDEILKDLRKKGITNVSIVCPSFVVDCLETLEEIGIGLKELWQEMGGKEFRLIPCLNNNEYWVKSMGNFIRK